MTSLTSFDACIIGAGVIGLAIARALSLNGLSVVVLERNHAIGMETSSRNSEVIFMALPAWCVYMELNRLG